MKAQRTEYLEVMLTLSRKLYWLKRIFVPIKLINLVYSIEVIDLIDLLWVSRSRVYRR